jgi:hypothetical protein
MIIQVLLWIVETILFLLYGRFVLRTFRPGVEYKSSFTLTFLTGVVALSSLASILSLIMRLSFEALLIVFGGGLIFFIKEWRLDRLKDLKALFSFPTNGKVWLFIGLVLLGLVLDLSTRKAANPDTGIYHAQAIHWIEVYPAVPGLGNLHTRFAFNSSWLVINALFSFAFMGIQSFHALPGLLVCVFCMEALIAIWKIYKRNARFSDWGKALLLPLAFFTIITESSSPGTDLPAILLLWFVLVEWMAEQEQPGVEVHRPLVIGITAIFAVTVKLSIAPILLFAVIVFFQLVYKRRFREAGILSLFGILILLPWFARNVVLSGYLIYPQTVIDWFHPDWKIPLTWAAREQNIIQAWARIPREDTDTVLGMPFLQWAKIWFFNQRRLYQAMLCGVALVPLLATLTTLLFKKIRTSLSPEIHRYYLGYVVIYTGLVFWFLTAPDLRFGFGFVIGALVLGLLLWVILLSRVILQGAKIISVMLLLITLFFWGVQYRSIGPRNILTRIFIPTAYTSMSTAPCKLGDKTILCAEWYNECGYNAFPCVPSANPKVVLRGSEWSEGFRWISP